MWRELRVFFAKNYAFREFEPHTISHEGTNLPSKYHPASARNLLGGNLVNFFSRIGSSYLKSHFVQRYIGIYQQPISRNVTVTA